MPSNIKKYIAISALMPLFGATDCFAKPPETDSKAKSSSAKQSATRPTVSKSNDTSTKSTKSTKQVDAAPSKGLFEVEENNSTVSDFAREYAAIMKKATAAIHISRPLKMDEEKQLWADYKSGKYAKNKEFMRNMKLAEPYHNRLRSILHVFESQKFKRLDFSQPAPAQQNQPSNK